ncbi:YceD family protein [Jatrophihabitans sp.]|uniref:YceD family protein n=1 Tax=Jatrophihabitans sp. TaxID=1932789 RepID=UPI002C9BF0EE|nr:YceD family protein [Jatrophihabitans sp.]
MNPRSPFVLDTRKLGRRAGSQRHHRLEIPAPAQLGLEMIGVPEGTPLVVDVRLEAVTEGVLVTGSVTGTVSGECGRCLTAFTDGLAVDFVELFAYPDSATEETTDPDEVSRIEAEHLDLEPVVRDAVVLSLPLTPLCRADCRGLCPECGELLDDLPDDHTHEAPLDPRWAALAERFSAADEADSSVRSE